MMTRRTDTIPQTSEPTVFIVDDDPEVRLALQQLFATVSQPVRVFENAATFLSAVPMDAAGCVLIDLRMPGMSGLELQRKLAEDGCTLPVIIVTAHAEVPVAVESMKLGAVDFLEKPYSSEKLLAVVRKALESDREARAASSERQEVQRRLDSLSPREQELLELLLEARATKEIAAALDISNSTVDFHRNNVLRKLGVEAVIEAVRMVERHRLSD